MDLVNLIYLSALLQLSAPSIALFAVGISLVKKVLKNAQLIKNVLKEPLDAMMVLAPQQHVVLI